MRRKLNVIVAALVIAFIGQVTSAEDVSAVKGSLVFAGGQLRHDNAAVWNRFIELAGGKGARVVVMPTAGGNPTKGSEPTLENLRRYGAEAEILPIAPELAEVDYKAAARDPANVEKLRKAGGIWFVGGQQRRITRTLFNEDGSRTPALEAIWEAYRNGAVIGGTSAGAAVMSRVMFADALGSLDTIRHGITKGKHVDTGLGLIGDDWFVDQHFLARGRFARALNAMRDCEFKYGIGVDEDTAVIFKDGRFDVAGYKGALVMDLTDAESDQSLPAFNLKKARLTYLDAGDSMDARTRDVTVSSLKAAGQKIDPQDKRAEHPFNHADDLNLSNILGAGVIYEAMSHVLESKSGVAKGLAFAHPRGSDKDGLGFEFKIYRGGDTCGWYSGKGGHGSYTVLNVYVDITPVKLASPLYEPLTNVK